MSTALALLACRTGRMIGRAFSPLSRRGLPPISWRNMLRINAFGSMSVVSDAGVLAGAAGQPRRLAILALLARAGDRGIQREKILELLWIDVEPEQARRTFAKALHALRRDLGADDAIIGGTADVRLNPAVITSDVRDFEVALAEGDMERAATLYTAPFLDAFRLPGAPEFERWAEGERDALARDYEHTLEKLAATESARGNHPAAVRWLRKLAAQDPLNARHAVRLMRALADAGDRVGALHHARVYEALVEQELDMPPDRDVVTLAERLRHEPLPAPPAAVPATPVPAAPVVVPNETLIPATAAAPLPTAAPEPSASPTRVSPRATRWLVAAGLVSIGIAVVLAMRGRDAVAARPDGGVIAVGRIADYRQPATSELARPLGDMLATNLARVPDLRVLSTARMYELLSDSLVAHDTGSAAMVIAARRAGARQLVDGALFQLADGHLRLDLRLIDLANGNVVAAHSASGVDPFALVDSATALLVAQAGAAAPTGSIADVSTRSMVAYRLYEEGLRAFTSGQLVAADRLMQAASAEDSTFAMAAYYGARTALKQYRWPDAWDRFSRARRFAARASERERLLIELEFALQTYAPSLRTLADSFVSRFPHDVDGYLYAGLAAIGDGRFRDAIRHLERVIEMDSLGKRDASAQCVGCEAISSLLVAYHAMDSIDAMVREGRRWTRLQPRSAAAWRALTGALAVAGKPEEALAALRTSAAFSTIPDEPVAQAHLRLRAQSFVDADRDLRDAGRSNEPERRAEMLWMLVISQRYQGRLDSALALARRFRVASPRADAIPALLRWSAIAEAQVQFERGAYASAAAIFDSLASVTAPVELASFAAKTRVWMLVHAATARAAMRDTASLEWMIDSLRVIGARSYLARDQRLHHYARGLLLVARGRDDAAAEELREAIWSPTIGFTRANYELGKVYLRLGRPREAVAILQPALRGAIDASNLYLTRTELHEVLAQAWEAAGVRDSAAAHYRAVVRAWEHADPMLAARRDSAMRALAR